MLPGNTQALAADIFTTLTRCSLPLALKATRWPPDSVKTYVRTPGLVYGCVVGLEEQEREEGKVEGNGEEMEWPPNTERVDFFICSCLRFVCIAVRKEETVLREGEGKVVNL